MQKRIFDKLIAAVLVFSVIWCVILPIGLKKHLNHWFFEVHAPAYGCLSLCKNLQNFWALRSESKITLINYCRDLARENALLKLKIAENTQNIACLKKSYEPPLYEEFRYLPARVCKRQFDSWAQLLIVNRGKKDGVAEGQGVICSQGIVGRIAEAHSAYSIVELVSHPKFRLLVQLENRKAPLVLQGTVNNSITPPTAYLLNLNKKQDLTKPLNVVTTSLGQQFPSTLFVGQLTSYKEDKTFVGIVQLGRYLNWLEEVSILIPNTANTP